MAYMDFHLPKMLSQFSLLLGTNVLVAEENHTPLRNQQGKLVSLLTGEVFELEPLDLRPDVRSQVSDFGRGRQEGALGSVGTSACLGVWTVCVPNIVQCFK